MKSEFTINPYTGEMVVRRASSALLTRLQTYLGPSVDAECGQSHQSPVLSHYSKSTQVRIAAVVHGSLVDGPGLRSVAFMQGCPFGCSLCQSSHTHSSSGGIGTTVSALMSELVRWDVARDGVTLSGGEPLAQPEACAKIVAGLKTAGIHVIVYSGFIYEDIVHAEDPAIDRVLALADVLVDGPFIVALRDESLAYRGSSNQRIIDLAKTRETGKLSLLKWE